MRFLAAFLTLACFTLATGSGLARDEKPKAIPLFNGKDLSGFYTYLVAPAKGQAKLGKNNDPKKVFSVKDGMIHVSGEVYGCFTTEKEYENYLLITEFKWGEKTWAPRDKATRDSGILLHCVGEDGAAGAWMESIECQMIEGGTGDFILVGGKAKPSMYAKTIEKATGKGEKKANQPYYSPDGQVKKFMGGRINWYGRDPEWTDTLGFRGKQDVEKPVGEWNRLECLCQGDNITITLNGVKVNDGFMASHTKGKILFQSEGAELFFRKIDLVPLK
ncbi:MAG: DUF1080 domain-containing protein [Gemmataceae bacterium]|nr:DUF1080 domain-containing protein [Gemmataceae bacterium]